MCVQYIYVCTYRSIVHVRRTLYMYAIHIHYVVYGDNMEKNMYIKYTIDGTMVWLLRYYSVTVLLLVL